MGRPSQVILVVEDKRHQQLIYRYLLKLGWERHAIRSELSPSGSGSAENWVRRRFVKEMGIYRSRHAQTKLIVVLDADTYTVQARLRQLDQALQENGALPVNVDTERIVRLIPKRNIETWILCLNEEKVDETTDYKRTRDNWGELIRIAAEILYRWTRSNTELPTSCVNSLRNGVEELSRLDD